MQSIEATLTGEGLVAVPKEIRERLGLAPGDTMTFLVDDDDVRLVTGQNALRALYGAVKAIPGMSADFDGEIETATSEDIAVANTGFGVGCTATNHPNP